MRVLLLQPNYDAHVIHPPLGLGYLASFLRQKGHQSSIFDGTIKKSSAEGFVQAVAEFSPDLVGISVLTRGHNKAKDIILAIKKKYPKVPIVIGGSQVTAAPSSVLEDLKADFGVIGEGEITLCELVTEIENKREDFKKIDGLAFRRIKGKIFINSPRSLIKDLDSIPFPAWDLMPPKEYRIVPILEPGKAFPIAPIITSRGCPYNCSFCASNVTWKRKIRFRSPENVLEEIELLKNNFGVKEIHFADDNFTMDTKRAEEICDRLIEENIKLPWQCPNGVRIDRLPLSLLRKMKKAGCYAVGLGIESGNQKILDKNSKNLNLKVVPQVLEDLRKVGIESYGFFILGLPGDTKQTINETIDFALTNPFDRVWFNLFTPYPGSPAFNNWLGSRRVGDIDWDKHDCLTAVVRLRGVSGKELEKLQKVALRKFYLRPRSLFKLLVRLRPREVLTLFMSRFFGKIGKPLFMLAHKFTRR